MLLIDRRLCRTIMQRVAIDHRKLLGVLYLLFGIMHAVAFLFLFVIVLVLTEGGIYYRLWMTENVLLPLSITGGVTLFSVIAGYGLNRERQWASIAALIAGVVIITAAMVCLWILTRPHITTNRALIVLAYTMTCLGLCAYSIKAARRI